MDGCRRQSDHDASARSHRVNEHAIWRHAKGDICREIARAALCGMTGLVDMRRSALAYPQAITVVRRPLRSERRKRDYKWNDDLMTETAPISFSGTSSHYDRGRSKQQNPEWSQVLKRPPK